MCGWPSPANLGRKFQVGVLQPGLEKSVFVAFTPF